MNTQKGIEIREAHYPNQAPLDAYGNGGFRFAEMSHKGSLMCLPSGIYGWDVSNVSEFTRLNFKRVLDEADAVEILLVGTGVDLLPIDANLRQAFRDKHISADSMSTGAAVRTYNVLVAEGRAVAGAFLAVG